MNCALSLLDRQASHAGDGISFTIFALIPGLIFGGTVGTIAAVIFAGIRRSQ